MPPTNRRRKPADSPVEPVDVQPTVDEQPASVEPAQDPDPAPVEEQTVTVDAAVHIGGETVTDVLPAVDEQPPQASQQPDPDEDMAQVGLVDEPCRRCYPAGWPSRVKGTHVSCHHGLSIRYGQPVEITRAQAVELGFIDE